MDFKDFLEIGLKDLEQKGLRRRMKDVAGMQGPVILIDGKQYLNFCSNDYLGLARDSRLGQAVIECLKQEGVGSGASRLVCGNMDAHRRLERAIADFKKSEDCILFSTGYMANVGIISSLFGRNDTVFSDRLNHASIIDGILLSGANMKRYPHCDMEALEEMLKSDATLGKKAIITDTVFSMDGDVAPLERIVELAEEYDCIVMIDEAHALGVLGEHGKGAAEHFGVEKKIDIQMGTLSKAAGCFGAYCCGSKNLIAYLVNKARSFIYTTGMPPVVAAAGRKAIEIIQSEPQRRNTLWENANYMRASLKMMGFDTLNSTTPIIPIMVKQPQMSVDFANGLYERQILISAIRPPTVPEDTARLRVAVSASHAKLDIDQALNRIEEVGKKLCLI